MKYVLIGHDRDTAVQATLISLLPDETHPRAEQMGDGEDGLVSEAVAHEHSVSVTARAFRGGVKTEHRCEVPAEGDTAERKRQLSYAVKLSVYRALLPLLSERPVWGAMTGVKPAKPARFLLEAGGSEVEATRHLVEHYDVTPRRAAMAVHCAAAALEAERALRPREVQLYIGIPFCPAKCSYCSFVSDSTQKAAHLVEPYLAALLDEISAASELLARTGASIGSLYIGGGTPTVLNESQLDRLLDAVCDSLPLGDCREYTVEAGRPETITRDKLRSIAAHGAHRISINPQSMRDDVLRGVGRLHTAQDIVRAYALARETADFCINMDLIAGLPGDDDAGLYDSVRKVAQLAPENVTLHCLARKKGAPLRYGKQGVLSAAALDVCYDHLAESGYAPYYLYRQKYSAGLLENVGFCISGAQSHYNICMMEELGSVIALGAGGVTKLCWERGEKIARVSNPKYPHEYIASRREIAERKRNLFTIDCARF